MFVSPDASPPSSAPLAPGAGPAAADGLDPELLALPDPPKGARSLTLVALLLTVAASLAMVVALRRDVTYAFARSTPSDAGELRTVDPASLASLENQYVSAQGMLGAAGGIRYERPLTSGSFRALPVAGRDDVWVEVRLSGSGENGRWEPPKTFAGRLVRFGTAGPRHRGLAEAIGRVGERPVSKDAWLLVDGEPPSGSAARGAIALAALFLGFAIWNLAAFAKLVRKVA